MEGNTDGCDFSALLVTCAVTPKMPPTDCFPRTFRTIVTCRRLVALVLLAVSPPRTEHLSHRDETCDADDERLLTVDLSAAVITTAEMTAARRADVIHHTRASLGLRFGPQGKRWTQRQNFATSPSIKGGLQTSIVSIVYTLHPANLLLILTCTAPVMQLHSMSIT